jgi:pimeloyl-ACP methyl ester carboxylesterase
VPGEALLLLPGLLCDESVWRQQVEELGAIAGCAVADYGSLDSLTAMAESVLRGAPERFSLAGHSMGGRVALEVYRLAPHRVVRLALLNTGYKPLAPGPPGEEEARRRWELVDIAKTKGMRAMAREWLGPMLHPSRRNDAPLVDAILDMMERKTPGIFAAQVRALLARPDAAPVLEQVQCPTLLLSGREDTWSPPAQHAEMAAKVAGSKLVIVPDCGHMSTMEQPEQVSRVLRSWLATAVS